MIIDHVGFAVSDLEASKAFYNQALGPLGVAKLMEIDHQSVGYGKEGKTEFWINSDTDNIKPMHAAFVAQNHNEVMAFHAAAIAAGGKDNGEPAIRSHYHSNYYAAYIIDPDGHNIEAVCHAA
ncbi:MAG: VOC family protein [Coxiellaceae bacterium]|nr:VOC family protein [Coxiellaceae bacterium]